MSDPAMLTQGSPRVRYCYDTERRVSMHEIWIYIFGNELKYGRTLHCSAKNLLVFNSALGVCVWTYSSYESTMNSFQLHVKLKKKNLSPLKEPWSPVGKSDLLTNSDWFLRLK